MLEKKIQTTSAASDRQSKQGKELYRIINKNQFSHVYELCRENQKTIIKNLQIKNIYNGFYSELTIKTSNNTISKLSFFNLRNIL